MYLTLSMLGFSSSLFGYEKKIIIPLRDIVSLKKDRTTKFSINSIKVCHLLPSPLPAISCRLLFALSCLHFFERKIRETFVFAGPTSATVGERNTEASKQKYIAIFLFHFQIVTQSGDKHNFGSLKNRDKIYSLLFRVLRMNVDPDKVSRLWS